MRSTVIVALIAMTCMVMAGQSEFEVAAIKPSPPGPVSSANRFEPGRFTATGTLAALIQMAYGLQDFEIKGGPNWIGEDRYDVVAKTFEGQNLSRAQMLPLIQKLLEDRFKLKTHREPRELPVYFLLAGSKGPKLAPNTDGAGGGTSSGAGRFQGRGITLVALATQLERQVGRRVIDRTGITGNFDIKLEWARDQNPDTVGPTLFTAIQEQLGLKLEAGKAPVSILVIDSAERVSEN